MSGDDVKLNGSAMNDKDINGNIIIKNGNGHIGE